MLFFNSVVDVIVMRARRTAPTQRSPLVPLFGALGFTRRSTSPGLSVRAIRRRKAPTQSITMAVGVIFCFRPLWEARHVVSTCAVMRLHVFMRSSQVKPEISAHSRPRTGPLGVTSA